MTSKSTHEDTKVLQKKIQISTLNINLSLLKSKTEIKIPTWFEKLKTAKNLVDDFTIYQETHITII